MRIACLQDSTEDTAWKLRYLSSCGDPKIHHQKDNKKKKFYCDVNVSYSQNSTY